MRTIVIYMILLIGVIFLLTSCYLLFVVSKDMSVGRGIMFFLFSFPVSILFLYFPYKELYLKKFSGTGAIIVGNIFLATMLSNLYTFSKSIHMTMPEAFDFIMSLPASPEQILQQLFLPFCGVLLIYLGNSGNKLKTNEKLSNV